MTETSYTKSLSGDFPNGRVDLDVLSKEIRESSIAQPLMYIDASGNDVVIWFSNALSAGDETTLTTVVAAHAGNPAVANNIDPQGNPVIAISAFAYVQDKTKFHGYRYVAPPNTVSIFDEQVTTQLYVQGGKGVLTGAEDGDFVEFSIIDKDNVLGLFSTYGLTPGVDILELDKYVVAHYPPPGTSDIEHRVQAAGKVYQGLYFRLAYHAINAGSNRVIRVTYLWYEDING